MSANWVKMSIWLKIHQGSFLDHFIVSIVSQINSNKKKLNDWYQQYIRGAKKCGSSVEGMLFSRVDRIIIDKQWNCSKCL